MITGYTVGTRVKWNEENAFETGVVMRVYRADADIEVDGEMMHVEVSDKSPAYLVMRDDGGHVVLSHVDVMQQRVNVHT